jgi:type VI secretion system secreted protein VgrG
MPFTQKDRLMSIHTSLGEDAMLLQGFTGHEGISQLFTFDLHLLREGIPIPHEELVGQNATIQLILRGDESRYFNGFISRLTQVAGSPGIFHSRAELVPWLWFLTQTADCRIFQEKTVPDIIEQIFKEYGFSDYKFQLGTYEPREYCVQYRETDYQFVSRLMEQYGIFYFWEHAADKHTLVVADDSSSHQPIPSQASVHWDPAGSAGYEEDMITSLEFKKDFRPGTFTHRGFDFKQSPSSRLSAHTEPSIIDIGGNSAFEIYDYEGKYEKKKTVTSLAKVRMQEEEAQHFVISGASTCKAFSSGYKYTLEGNLPVQWQTEHVLTSLHHQGSMGNTYNPGRPTSEEDGDPSYTNTFTCIPFTVPFRPPQLTPKPVVQGPQTAIVVGKKGEEIWVDKYGRVKVLFHWDREGKGDEQSSCWVRVSQLWAGKQWGTMFLPRIGQEVIVEFLEGDPDRPIITGRVYNAENIPPYELPAEQTKATIKSNSSKGGKGFNEIRFEDKKGDEQIFIHGEKNIDIRINNDRFETIGKDGEGSRHLVVEKDKFEQIKNNRNEKVANDHLEEIGNDRNLKVTGKEAKEVKKSLSLQVSDDVIEVFKKNQSTQITKDLYIKADNIVLEAATNITIKVGQSFIAVEAGGITIGTSGTLELESQGPLSAESKAKTDIKAPTTAVNGDATVIIKGGLVKIN